MSDDLLRKYETGKQIKFYTSMLKSRLCGYNGTYIFMKGTITITEIGVNEKARKEDTKNNQATFKNCVPFPYYNNQTNNTQVGNAEYLDILMSMYKLIVCSHDYVKSSRRLWQHPKDI